MASATVTDEKARHGTPPALPVEPAGSGGISFRALLLGLLLVPLSTYWVIVAELRWYILVTLNPLFVTPVFYLFALVLLNAGLRRVAPRWVLTRAELVVLYVMLVLSCTIATHDFLINLMSSMPWARWFATPENAWETTMFPHLPRWLLVWDKDLLEGCFKGNSSFYEPAVLRMWLAPLAFWSLFIFLVGWIMLCMNVLLRRAWIDQTRLSFPIVRLPLALTEGFSPGSMLCSAALWLGFAAAGGVNVLNGLHEWFPTLPHVAVGARWNTFPTLPWAAAGAIPTTFYPYAIGLAFLVPLDISFSCWFFYLFMKAQSVVGWLLGYGNVPDFPYVSEQGIGAWAAFGVVLLYTSRRYLRHVVRVALGPKSHGHSPGVQSRDARPEPCPSRVGRAILPAGHRGAHLVRTPTASDPEDANEPLSYRVAFWGLVAGAVAFTAFWWAAGMSPVWAFVAMGAYLIVSICITRVRAEAGGQHTVWDLEPKNLFRLFDSQMLGPANLGAAAVSHWYWRLNRGHMMPNQMEAFKLAQESGVRLRSLVVPMAAAVVLTTIVGMWTCLHLFYAEGALTKCRGFALWSGHEAYDWLGNSLNSGFRAETGRWGAIGGSVGLIVLLSWMRVRFVRFPFHPLGYCIGPGLVWHWCPFFIAWLAKLLILRYGGLRFYRRALPFFLGLVLGDYTVGALWTLVGVIGRVPTYQFEFF